MVIGIIDSGIGGLNLLAKLIKLKCANDYIYFADNQNMPFGNKSPQRLCEIAKNDCKKLIAMGANVIIFACNTLSTNALDYARETFTEPIFGLLPQVHLPVGETLVMVTTATALKLPPLNENQHVLIAEKLASLIESNYPYLEGETTEYLQGILSPYRGVKNVVLGCSHYPYATQEIMDITQAKKCYDGIEQLSNMLKEILPLKSAQSTNINFIFSARDESYRYGEILTNILHPKQ